MTEQLLTRVAAQLRPEPARVIARLFLPGEEPHDGRSRAAAIVERVMALDEAEVEVIVANLLDNFGTRHRHYDDLLDRHATVVAGRLGDRPELSAARTRLVGAAFTAEYSTESAAVLNPSAFIGPDQSGLSDGQVRAVVSLRTIGEGHLSCITFCTAVVGPGPEWTFEQRTLPATLGSMASARWTVDNLRSVLSDQVFLDELDRAVLHALPAEFDGIDLEHVIADMHRELTSRPGGHASVDLLRRLVHSAYRVTFDDDTLLSQRVLFPFSEDESNGMEDARFTRFVRDDGTVDYRGTYTAYDGRQIAPRLLQSDDLRTFQADRLAGPAARNKGMALFPRLVNGRHLALCRTDGESTSLASSGDGHTWSAPTLLVRPKGQWELLQIGNCGPPIETDRGWLVLTHSVAAMRVYTIGAILLDLDDPTQVIGHLADPLLVPGPDEQDGYVPNVVYSCGGIVHDGMLWLPFGIDDSRVGVACGPLTDVLDAMRPGA